MQNLNSNLFGDEDGLAYLLSFDEMFTDPSHFDQEYFPGLTSGEKSYLFRRTGDNAYDQSVVFIPSNMTVDTIYEDLNQTHAKTTLFYNNPTEMSEYHPYGRNNYFVVNGTERVS